MSDATRHRPDLRLTEAEARRALERAAWNEAQKDSLTVAELTRVAEEAGYSREYVESAIDEILEERGLATRPAAPGRSDSPDESAPRQGLFARLRTWLQPIRAGLAGGIIGVLARRMAGFSTVVVTDGVVFMVGIVIAIIAVLAFHHRRTGRQTEFQLQTAGLWVGFMIGWVIIHGAVQPELIRGVATFWFLTGSLGGAIVHFRGNRHAGAGEETPGPA
jgi:hypothetical protein